MRLWTGLKNIFNSFWRLYYVKFSGITTLLDEKRYVTAVRDISCNLNAAIDDADSCDAKQAQVLIPNLVYKLDSFYDDASYLVEELNNVRVSLLDVYDINSRFYPEMLRLVEACDSQMTECSTLMHNMDNRIHNLPPRVRNYINSRNRLLS